MISNNTKNEPKMNPIGAKNEMALYIDANENIIPIITAIIYIAVAFKDNKYSD